MSSVLYGLMGWQDFSGDLFKVKISVSINGGRGMSLNPSENLLSLPMPKGIGYGKNHVEVCLL